MDYDIPEAPGVEQAVPPRVTSRVRTLRTRLAEKFGDDQFGVRACARRAHISERQWWSYERGENMPPVDVGIRIADVLGVTVTQLEFRRVEEVPPESDPS